MQKPNSMKIIYKSHNAYTACTACAAYTACTAYTACSAYTAYTAYAAHTTHTACTACPRARVPPWLARHVRVRGLLLQLSSGAREAPGLDFRNQIPNPNVARCRYVTLIYAYTGPNTLKTLMSYGAAQNQ